MTVDDLIAKWLGKQGGGERAEYQHFLTELAQALGVPSPGDPGFATEDFRFEAPVRSAAVFGNLGTKRIDLYKRDCFVLEAKQSRETPGNATIADEPVPVGETIFDLFGTPIGVAAPTGKPRPRYDRLMSDARLQAERYALALPEQHRAPPFLIVADIRRSFELYFDFSGNGRGYAPFPNELSYRSGLADLASDKPLPDVRLSPADTLRANWRDPASIDPRLRAAEVTRQVAERLSRVAGYLENVRRKERPDAADAELALGIEETSLFVMRLLFCMFAEDVELLPKGRFTALIEEARDITSADERQGRLFWQNGLDELWRLMAQDGEDRPYWTLGRDVVKYFNGNLFLNRKVFPLPTEFLGELAIAAKKEWKNVEPAIFGTLLEQVLTPTDRAKLGAHYTPRAYVERLVQAVILDVLRPEWEKALEGARAKIEAGDRDGAIADARIFHRRLCAVHVLDPACGTANFLYVAMEQLLRLEGEVRVFAAGLGADIAPQVHPNQFLGLELNPRAAVIAELVLWIGWLRYRLANSPEAIKSPVLPPLSNINGGTHGGYNAVLALTETGQVDLDNPRQPPWPEADFIVGNPPFIGGKDIRARLGGEEAEALWKANPGVPKSADFVMHWWDRAAAILTSEGTRLRRFGFVTTNSITQVFLRRVIEKWLAQSSSPERGGGPSAQPMVEGSQLTASIALADSGDPSTAYGGPPPRSGEELKKLHLTLAIPDHPWTRVTKDAAAVRIAMTVAEVGAGTGKLIRITGERALDTDVPELEEAEDDGVIHADLTVGTDVTSVVPLKANEGLCSNGMKPLGSGFLITKHQLDSSGITNRDGWESVVWPYVNGRDLSGHARGMFVLDLFGLEDSAARRLFPEVYQHLLATVLPERVAAFERSPTNDNKEYLERWWTFCKPRQEMRSFLGRLSRFIVTTQTSKHRIFQFVDHSIMPDQKLMVFGLDNPFFLGVFSSRIHTDWATQSGGWLGVGNDSVYVKRKSFDPFPFPLGCPEDHPAIQELSEELDVTRRIVLDDNVRLTMTGLYNLVAAIRDGTLPPDQEQQAVRARARIVAKLHDDLDLAVADAYGWGEEWARAPLPPAEIVARLVALNAERAAEEKAGTIRWLRPDYQVPRFG